MKKLTVSEHLNRDRLHLFFHLIPVVGFFPSLWTLYRHERAGSRDEQGAGEESRGAEGAEGQRSRGAITNYQLPITTKKNSPSAVYLSL
nr:hypothetical protein [Chroococcidiopsis sp. [FACHB-1243]]